MLHLTDLTTKLTELRTHMHISPFPYQHPVATPAAAAAAPAHAPSAAESKRPTLDMSIFQRSNSKKLYEESKRSGTREQRPQIIAGIQSPTHAAVPWHTLSDDRKRELLKLYQEDMPEDLANRFILSKKKGAVIYDPFKRRILQLGSP